MPTTSSAQGGVDQDPLQPGVNEELAGPPHLPLAPVLSSERISSVDALRGFALLGILIANLPAFAYPPFLGLFPVAMVHPVFSGPHHAVNTAIWFFRWIVAEGKMRALFSILFGAGCILLTERAEARGAGVRTADIYLRRNLWLVAFGIFHCFFIWHGDILFFYGLTGLIFLFPFRNLKAKTLLWCSAAVVLVAMTCGVQARWSVFTVLHEHRVIQEANTAVAHHEPRNSAQMQAIANETQRNRHQPNLAMTYQSIAESQQDYLATRLAEAPENYEDLTKVYFLLLPDTLSMMLLGMALYKVGFLSGRLPLRSYAITALVGLGISWPLLAWESWFALQHQFSPWGKVPMQISYDLGRISGARRAGDTLNEARHLSTALSFACRRRPAGTLELSADQHRYAVRVRLGAVALVRLSGVLPGIRSHAGYVGHQPDRESTLVALLSLRTRGMVVAFPHVLEETAHAPDKLRAINLNSDWS
jgi:uncharacterized protein